MPKTSIIIRTFNEKKHIGNLLSSIIRQDYQDYEIIVVDSGSIDGTLEIISKFGVKIIKIESRDFTFGYALNVGCRASSGEYLVFVSAHILPTNDQWLSNLIAPFSDEKIAMVYGRQMGNEVSKFSEKNDLNKIFGLSALNSRLPLYYANNANSAVRKILWKERPFNERLFGLEDIDWARDMTNKGYIVHYEPKAAIYHIHEEEWHQVFNRYRREAIAAVRIGLDRPPQASTHILWALMNLLRDILISFPNYSRTRIEEIIKFRYYQWKGSKTGWSHGKEINFKEEKNSIFRPGGNSAVVIKNKGEAEFEEMPIPELKPGDLLVKVEYVGVCRTDLEIYDGTLGYYRDGIAKYPIVPGHEFSGTIVKIGSNNRFQERLQIGQKIVGECILARGGANQKKEVGVINHNGAYGTYVVIPGDAIHKIPEGLDLKTATLTEPLAVVLRGIRRIKHKLLPDSLIAVIGAGPIGNLCAQALALEGYKVDVFDKNTERLEIVKKNVNSVHPFLNGLEAYDIIIETTGSKDVLVHIIKIGRNDNTVLLLGFPYGTIEYNFEDLISLEKLIVGSVGGDKQDFVKALELLPKLDTIPFTRTVMPLKNFDKAWKGQRSHEHLKVLLQP